MKKKQLLLELLNQRKVEVEEYRRNREYGEWSCGQQDADAEEAEHWDKTMKQALMYIEDRAYGNKLTEQEVHNITELIADVINDFKVSAEHYFGVY